MKTVGLFVLLLGTLPTLAQQTGTQSAGLASGQPGVDNLRALGNLGSFSTGMAFDNSYAELKGTPYTVSRWLPGVVYLRRGIQANDASLKYDAYAQRLLALRSAKDSIMVDLSQVERFVLLDTQPVASGTTQRERVYQRLPDDATIAIKNAFVEVLYTRPEGSYALYKLPRKRLLKKPATQRGFDTGRNFDELIDVSELYLRVPGGRLEKVKVNQKALEAVLPLADAQRLRQLKLIIKTENDLREVIATLDANP